MQVNKFGSGLITVVLVTVDVYLLVASLETKVMEEDYQPLSMRAEPLTGYQ